MPHLRIAPAPSTPACLTDGERAIRVVLADDHALMLRTLRVLLEGEKGVEVIGEAGDLGSLTRRVDNGHANVLVLDLGMLCGSSEAIRQLRRRFPQTQIVIVTMEENTAYAQRALAAGAVGFVLKDQADEELIDAIRLAVRGEAFVSPRLAGPLNELRRAAAEANLGRGLWKA